MRTTDRSEIKGGRINRLPETFTFGEAREAGLSGRAIYALRDRGEIARIGHGIYQRQGRELGDIDLAEIAIRAPDATLCLATALSQHGLIDLIPSKIDVAIPRGRRRPRTDAPALWHHFAPETFFIGRQTLAVDSTHAMGIYEPRRCLIDMFRLRHREGSDLAYAALRRWLARPEARPASLLEMARKFPQAEPALRHALEVLL